MRNHMTDTQTGSISYTEIVHALSQGTEQLLQELKSVPRIHLQSYYVELENIQQFLETLSFIQDTMSNERLQDTLHNTLHSLRQSGKNIPADILTHLHDVKLDSEHGIPAFLIKTTHQLGPFLRFGKNEMTAWMRLNSNEAPFFTPQNVITCLQNHGITHGILEEEIQNLFANQTFDEEVCIAK
ncbi:hypothetical protein GF373_15900, partial [bacterium]|nr:hypothetical protein [bacterium]